MWLAIRGLVSHAWPVFVAQIASIGMMLVDTAVLGHVSAADLAAVAIGGGVHISLVFALVGVVQAVAPMAAHLHGAQRDGEVAAVLRQGFVLAWVLSFPGVIFLCYPGVLLDGAGMDATVAAKVRDYLVVLAWGLPAALSYRTFYAFCNALGRPRVLMAIGLLALLVHGLLAWGLAEQGWLGARWQGVSGCALSNVVIAWLAVSAGAAYLSFGPLKTYRPFAGRYLPDWPIWRELLRLGVPMGLSNLVEITAFTLVALLIAPLGAEVVAGHRIVANLSALAYMLPLSLGIATLSAVGLAAGARDWGRVRLNVQAAMLIAALASTLSGLTMWLATEPIVNAYTSDAGVRSVAAGLVAFVAVYQFFDAVQTIAGHVLRACRVTLVPMLLQMVCFWGVGLAGGYALCYRWSPPLGVAGFWLAAVLSLVLAAGVLTPLMRKVLREAESAL